MLGLLRLPVVKPEKVGLPSAHNATLDGLRGVAALAVVWFHLTRQNIEAAGAGWPCRGYLSVDFFFILSGYVIARAYAERLQAGLPVLAFCRQRIIRLYPLILLALSIHAGALLYAGAAPGTLGWDFLREVLLIPSGQRQLFPWDFPLWSLMFELWVNLVFAALAPHRRVLHGASIAGCLGGLGWILWYVVVHGTTNGGAETPYVWLGAGRVLFGFFAGVLMFRWMTPARVAALPSVPFPVLGLVLLGSMSIYAGLGAWYDLAMITLVFPAIILLGMKDVAGRARPFALVAGAVSYPVYVLHGVTVLNTNLYDFNSPLLKYAGFSLACAALVLGSLLVLRWYDLPVRRVLANGRKGRAAAPRRLRHQPRLTTSGSTIRTR